MSLVTTTYVKGVIGLSDSELTGLGISDNQIQEHIYDAEGWIEKYCMTTFLNEEVSNVSVSSATSTSITASGVTWTTNAYSDYYLYVKSGTGIDQYKKISSNSTAAIVLESALSTQVDNTSKINILYAPYTISKDKEANPNQIETVDGNGKNFIFTHKNPILKVDAVTINSTIVTPSNVYLYTTEGKLQLKTSAEKTYFDNSSPQLVTLNYWFGITPVPRIVKKAVGLFAGISVLVQQMGGTFDDLSTFSLPELSGSIGQAYVNINAVVTRLKEQLDSVLPQLPTYYKFG